jgi:ABC-2 type transport system permease protein
MIRILKIYPALLHAYWQRALVYRGAFVIWVASTIFPLVMMTIWMGMAQGGRINGYGAVDFAGYYLATLLVRRITGCGIVQDLEDLVRTGELAAYLVKPLGVAHYFFARVTTQRVVAVGFLAVPVGVGMLLTPGLQFDLGPANLLLFVIACGVGLLFEFITQYFIGGLSFWIVQARGINIAYSFVKMFFGGYLAPLALFPPSLQSILRWLPFQSSIGLPVDILAGRAPAPVALIAVCGLWVLLLGGLAWQLWRAGIRTYSAVGA